MILEATYNQSQVSINKLILINLTIVKFYNINYIILKFTVSNMHRPLCLRIHNKNNIT